MSTLHCSIGKLDVYASDLGITALKYNDDLAPNLNSNPNTSEAVNQLKAYLKNEIKTFDLPLDMQGTEFEKSVWNHLLTIPYGQTTYYAKIAESVSSIKAVRAVGRANGKNPVPIIVPCHRVIGKDRSLVGFALGIDVKLKLLNLENPQGFGKQMSLAL